MGLYDLVLTCQCWLNVHSGATTVLPPFNTLTRSRSRCMGFSVFLKLVAFAHFFHDHYGRYADDYA